MGVRGLNPLVTLVALYGVVFAYDPSPSLDHSSATSPQQVHISQVGRDRMRISWITKDPITPKVYYGVSPSSTSSSSATGTTTSYTYLSYQSGLIHDVVIGPLLPNTVYYYLLPHSSFPFSLKTPPSHFPIKFAIVADIGQTNWTVSTLNHIVASNYDMMILPGDHSYADLNQTLWDSYGRLLEPAASRRPWMVSEGDHEVEQIPNVHPEPFTAFNARWRMPYEESGSESNLYYSFEVACVHVIMLGSYTDFNSSSEQYKWVVNDLRKVNRKKTPWLLALVHAPWYNSNEAHQGEPQSVDMKAAMEDLLYQARVDVVIAGHVHAYERFARVYKDKADDCGPAYIVVGDGGNHEGLHTQFIDPKPEISMFREASFGHGILEVFNETHAEWTWHTNDNDEAVASDSFWLINLSTQPACNN